MVSEYVGWMARYVQEKHLTDSIQVQLIDSQPRLMAHLGERAASRLEQIVSKLGVRLFTGQAVAEITEQEVRLNAGQRVDSDLTAVVGSLHGVDLGLTAPVVDEQGFVCVNAPERPRLSTSRWNSALTSLILAPSTRETGSPINGFALAKGSPRRMAPRATS